MRYAILSLCILTSACGQAPGTPVGDPGNDMFDWTDASTGCRYLIRSHKAGYAGMGGMTPKLRRDGTPDCPDARATK